MIFAGEKMNKYAVNLNVYGDGVKTTVILRDDVYERIVSEFGKRNISQAINEVLVKHLFGKKQKSMFGADKWLQKADLSDLRDKSDREF